MSPSGGGRDLSIDTRYVCEKVNEGEGGIKRMGKEDLYFLPLPYIFQIIWWGILFPFKFYTFSAKLVYPTAYYLIHSNTEGHPRKYSWHGMV